MVECFIVWTTWQQKGVPADNKFIVTDVPTQGCFLLLSSLRSLMASWAWVCTAPGAAPVTYQYFTSSPVAPGRQQLRRAAETLS